jgi:hypothetical protein
MATAGTFYRFSKVSGLRDVSKHSYSSDKHVDGTRSSTRPPKIRAITGSPMMSDATVNWAVYITHPLLMALYLVRLKGASELRNILKIQLSSVR